MKYSGLVVEQAREREEKRERERRERSWYDSSETDRCVTYKNPEVILQHFSSQAHSTFSL